MVKQTKSETGVSRITVLSMFHAVPQQDGFSNWIRGRETKMCLLSIGGGGQENQE